MGRPSAFRWCASPEPDDEIALGRFGLMAGRWTRSTRICQHTAAESGIDLTKARRLAQNAGVAFMGDTKGRAVRRSRRTGQRVAARACESERPPQLGRAQAVDERYGRHPEGRQTSGSSISAGR